MQMARVTDERMVLARMFQLCARHRERWREIAVKNLDDGFLFDLLFDLDVKRTGGVLQGHTSTREA